MQQATVERLYRKHNGPALEVLRHKLGGGAREYAEDALADAWVILAGKPDSYITSEEGLGGWLYIVARRIALRRYLPTKRLTPIDDVQLSAEDDVHALVIGRDRLRELLDFVSASDTSAARRRAVAARMVGVSYRELGVMTGSSYTQVNRHTAEGLKLARSSTRYAS